MPVSQLAVLIRGNVARTAEAARKASAALRTADRFLWLEDIHAAQRAAHGGTIEAPSRLTEGIELHDEQGDHAQLLAVNGHYVRMYRQQADAYA